MTARSLALALALCARSSVAQADAVDTLLQGRCVRDGRLLGAARLGLDARDPAVVLDAATLRGLAEHAGIPAPAVHLALVRGDTDADRASALRQWLDARPAPHASARCEVLTDGNFTSLALVPRLAGVAPVVTQMARGTVANVAIDLPQALRAPTLSIGAPDGSVTTRTLASPLSLRFETAGEHTLQVSADGPEGPQTWALWHIAVGAAPAPAAGAQTPLSSARALVAAINELRRARGQTALRSDPLLASVASRYAAMLASSGAVAHALDAEDSPVERLRRAHLHADRVAENAVRAASLEDAHARLIASPTHRANVLDASIDAVGVGVATSELGVYLVELFARHPTLGP